jgi:acetylornithine/succinyldiaminopimelate/putrescine aminotransferase
MTPGPSLAETCGQILRAKVPNLFRPYANPFVVQTCIALGEYVRTTWPVRAPGTRQTFLANSFDEALSGAIKLARYCANVRGEPSAGLVIDPDSRLGPFAAVTVGGRRIEFVPELTVIGADSSPPDSAARFGFVVLIASPRSLSAPTVDLLRSLLRRPSPLVITCVSRDDLADWRRATTGLAAELPPDVVVFDETFVNRDVPFGAFTAGKHLFDHWNRRGKSAFHSTTFQPNTISALHFVKCLEAADPVFWTGIRGEFERVLREPTHCLARLGATYSPFLAKAIRSLGLDTPHVSAAGHYVAADGRQIFDCVAGVACSIRGHNPEAYLAELGRWDDTPDLQAAVTGELKALTGLDHVLPAVSGASAVETALRLGLAAQPAKTYVLAFKGGFGGKTLLALTGTAKAGYKEHLDPLYEHVLYIDPFAPTALADLEAALTKYPVAVVQLELIQAVGGVRPVPPRLVEYLAGNRRRFGYLLFIDEVQTGMYRTGPFVLSRKLGVTPDLLTVGKGTSDMMVPFALTLYSDTVREQLAATCPGLPAAVRERQAYDWGYKTVLNVLDQAAAQRLPERVAEASALFEALLTDGLASCRAVRAVRVHGLLIAIELNANGLARRLLKKGMTWAYLAALLRDPSFPLFAGFCQYEPTVLKLTPPLTITPDEVQRVCATLVSVLRSPSYKVVSSAVRALVGSYARRRRAGGPGEKVIHESAAC